MQTTSSDIHTLCLHDALPILEAIVNAAPSSVVARNSSELMQNRIMKMDPSGSERMTSMIACVSMIGRAHRLNSSHVSISYAVFCLKEKKVTREQHAIG